MFSAHSDFYFVIHQVQSVPSDFSSRPELTFGTFNLPRSIRSLMYVHVTACTHTPGQVFFNN
jgi:hypothetical protein